MRMYDVVIIGAGPAGLFAAYELITNNPKLKVAILDKGKLAEERICPMSKDKNCYNCNPCNILSGYGGAGTFSDGKLNFTPKVGKSDLFKYLEEEKAYQVIDDAEKIFNKFNMDSQTFPSNLEAALEIKKKVALTGARLMLIKQKHLGSDKLPSYIKNFTDFLKDQQVLIKASSNVTDIKSLKEDEHIIIYQEGKKTKEIKAHNVIVAPGRTGAKWVQELADKYHIPYTSQSIEVGVRVEVRKEILEDICNVIYDPTIFIKTDTYGDEIRTFCTNPGGFVPKKTIMVTSVSMAMP